MNLTITVTNDREAELAIDMLRQFAQQYRAQHCKPMLIYDLDLPVRVLNCLEAQHICCVQELVTWSPHSLRNTPNLGLVGIRKIQDKLDQFGLRLSMPDQSQNLITPIEFIPKRSSRTWPEYP